ncbi:hypothetical protein [Polaromonas sp.]|jgi:hypothetical protein|uniref:hypothetical protein n=1 Tax=Polaromonas sp. TaxID=1869339 RepID=UPI002BB11E88|nr:hypothetical protein [Polaromonas sp.]HQS30808.1 hypothetical protein [Polaromonas sp.]HQS91075.1 hypothetical protein [Polaromonas sp.]
MPVYVELEAYLMVKVAYEQVKKSFLGFALNQTRHFQSWRRKQLAADGVAQVPSVLFSLMPYWEEERWDVIQLGQKGVSVQSKGAGRSMDYAGEICVSGRRSPAGGVICAGQFRGAASEPYRQSVAKCSGAGLMRASRYENNSCSRR